MRHPTAAGTSHSFTFSRVFGMHASQEQVYDEVARPLIRSILEGKNAAVLCHGQTGSGKTHTMTGPTTPDVAAAETIAPTDGIIPRLLVDIFAHVDALKGQSFSEVAVSVSHIELYQEHVLDLLDPTRQRASAAELARAPGLALQQEGGRIRVSGGTCVRVQSAAEVLRLLSAGNAARATAATACNARSSRSHAVCIVTIVHANSITGRDLCSQVYLCDLAGCERLAASRAAGTRLREAQHINRGLLALTNVINALVRHQQSSRAREPVADFVPYRDSKLTRLLQNAFGGNGRTAVVCNVNPGGDCYGETMSTLRFGARCQTVANTVRCNVTLRSRVELDRLLGAAEQIILHQKQQLRRLQLEQVPPMRLLSRPHYQRHRSEVPTRRCPPPAAWMWSCSCAR